MIHIKKSGNKTKNARASENMIQMLLGAKVVWSLEQFANAWLISPVKLKYYCGLYCIHAMSFKTSRENVLEFEACEKHMPHRKSTPQISLHFVVSESPLNFQINLERPQAWLYYIEWMCISNKTIVPILISELIIHIHGIIVSKPKKVS